MRRVAPKVEDELRKKNKYFGPDFVQNISEDDEVVTKKIFDSSIKENMQNVRLLLFPTTCICGGN